MNSGGAAPICYMTDMAKRARFFREKVPDQLSADVTSSPKTDVAVVKGEGRATRPKKRRDQQRGIETRETILRAALSEFAELGYGAASIRNIGIRTGLQHPLITYHYRSKEILWKAVAENCFAEIRKLWHEDDENDQTAAPMEFLRAKYFAFLNFTVSHPDFHHFMLRESQPGNPRLPWLVETILLPHLKPLLPKIREAQERGELPRVNPALVHYMLIGITSVLSSLRDEIRQSSGIITDDPKVIKSYFSLIDAMIFRPVKGSARPAKKTKPKAKSKQSKIKQKS